ncbi:Urmylation protein [Myotisia sp. PD_48]|nr:Urmylation protein [Myotisia sp. PD_48]
MKDIEQLRELLQTQIASTEAQLRGLREQLANLERDHVLPTSDGDDQKDGRRWPLLQPEYKRYGRQMIVRQIGSKGQLQLRNSAVLIVGAGGLGCPAAMYLAGAGVGKLGIVDGDTVEHSNLHRQVLHRTRSTGIFKVDSAIESLNELNPYPTYVPYRTHLTPGNSLDIFSQFDIILDCTDNPATRYLISDTAVLLGKTVVSASALRTEGQLTVLNYPPLLPGDKTGGPCYRCIFPKPPPADTVVSCADGGILGPVVGMMGVMQALETIRVLTAPAGKIECDATATCPIVPTLHLFSAYSTPPFRAIRLRPRRETCVSCSAQRTISTGSLRDGSLDYVQFCGSINAPSVLAPDERMTAKEYKDRYIGSVLESDPAESNANDGSNLLIDVRDRVQYDIGSLPHSENVPMAEILSCPASLDLSNLPSWLPPDVASANSNIPIHVVCRLGNDSQLVVKKLKELGLDRNGARYIGDIKGGLSAWRREVESNFPDY